MKIIYLILIFLRKKYKGIKSTSTDGSYLISRMKYYKKNISYKKYFLSLRSIIFAILTRGLTKKEITKSLKTNLLVLFIQYIKKLNKIGFFNTIDINNDSWMERHHNLNYLKKFKNIQFIPTKYFYVKKDSFCW